MVDAHQTDNSENQSEKHVDWKTPATQAGGDDYGDRLRVPGTKKKKKLISEKDTQKRPLRTAAPWGHRQLGAGTGWSLASNCDTQDGSRSIAQVQSSHF